jgi:hypothetical protein
LVPQGLIFIEYPLANWACASSSTVEHRTFNPQVLGSNPRGRTTPTSFGLWDHQSLFNKVSFGGEIPHRCAPEPLEVEYA